MTKHAMIIGATGLVGSQLLQLLLNSDNYEKVTALVRRPLPIKHPKLQIIQVDFTRLERSFPNEPIDDLFGCLGTTIKKAKSKEAMYEIDVLYTYETVKLAQALGLKHCLLISSTGANANSSIFYSRIKGELEEKLKELEIPQLSIFRPSLLVGRREEFRFGEQLAMKLYQGLAWVLPYSVKASLGLKAEQVAQAMRKGAEQQKRGFYIYKPGQIAALSNVKKE